MVILYHGTLVPNVSKILAHGIKRSEGWGGTGTSGTFLSGTPEGALYWGKLAYQREHGEDMDTFKFDRNHGHEVDQLIAILSVEIPQNQTKNLMADVEQFEDVGADFDPNDWKQSLKAIGDVRFDGPIPSKWVREVFRPSDIRSVIDHGRVVSSMGRRPHKVSVRPYRRRR